MGDFAADIQKILKQYEQETVQDVKKVTKKLANRGAKELRDKSGIFNGGNYASGWTSKVEEGVMSCVGIIYNKTPGLPHLLENGHALRNGGRMSGRTHIAPVEEQLVKDFEQAVRDCI